MGAVALLFLPSERVPIPAEYGGAGSGDVAVAEVDGASLFAANCAACHGFGGEGGRGPQLAGRFRDADLPNLRRQVQRGGLSMPAFAATLTMAEIDAVAAHVATLTT